MPTYFNGGFKVDEFGTLQTSSGPAIGYNQGVPVDADGSVVVSATAPVATDPFVAGQRILNTGELAITSDTPSTLSPWSNGFSSGFGDGA